MDLTKYEIRTERVRGVAPKQFNAGGTSHYYIRIWVQADVSDDLDKIRFVKYHLHPTFKKPTRLSSERISDFDIKIWTYGFFEVKVDLFFKDGSQGRISKRLEFEV